MLMTLGVGGAPAPGGAVTGTGGTAPNMATAQAGTAAPAPDAGMPTAVPPQRSSGCGAADFPKAGMQSIDVMGTSRDFIVWLPSNYDPAMPYKLIFAWHGLGGSAMQVAGGFGGGFYGLQTRAMNSAIFVAGQGLQTSNQVGSGAGWDNMNDRDVAFTKVMVDYMRRSYCVDDKRIFSVGMSYGGIMSNTVGCEMGDVFRAIAPMSGAGPLRFGGAKCVGQTAVWMSHGNMDMVVAFSSGQMSRDYWVGANHCGSMTMPEGSNGCVSYQGCDAGFPVIWCEFSGGHTVPTFAADEIWPFFSQF